jgi:2-methylcitrate dehydratase PrpD
MATPSTNPATKEALTPQLAAFAAALAFDELPKAVVAKVKELLLDTLGTTLAATTLGAGCREAIAVMQRLGGKPESTIFGSTTKVPAPAAAFANGGLAHALNYDPIGPEVGHVGVVCLTAPLAVAEAVACVSGREFLAGAAVAAEVTARVTAAIARTGRRPSEKFLAGQLLGYFGAAAGAGRVFGLTADEMHSALGLALMQASGSMQIAIGGDPPAKGIYGAFPNHGGVLAAVLAKVGLGAVCDVFEGRAGLYEMLYGGDCVVSALRDDLGTKFLLMGAQIKPWPTSTEVHPFIEAALEIAAGPIDPSRIGEVRITGPSQVRTWVEPVEIRRRPPNSPAAANSVQFAVAKALCHGEVTLADFTADGIADASALALAQRISHSFDDQVRGGRLEVLMVDGQRVQAYVEVPLGHPSRPVPSERIVAKFRDCCRYAARPLSASQVQHLIDMVENLEAVADVSTLTAAANGAS